MRFPVPQQCGRPAVCQVCRCALGPPSCSGSQPEPRRRAPVQAPRLWQQKHVQGHKERLAPCRLTNTNRELRDAMEYNVGGDYMYVDQQASQNTPGGVPILQLADRDYYKAIAGDPEHDVDDPMWQDYWFNEPEGGWLQEPKQVLKADTKPTKLVSAKHKGASGEGPEGRPRALDELEEGQVLTGTICRMYMYHGLVIDLGTDLDGLIPIQPPEAWESPLDDKTGLLLRDMFTLKMEVKVRVHRLWDEDLAVWPVQLELLEPDLSYFITSPDDFEPIWDLRMDRPNAVTDVHEIYLRTQGAVDLRMTQSFEQDTPAFNRWTDESEVWRQSQPMRSLSYEGAVTEIGFNSSENVSAELEEEIEQMLEANPWDPAYYASYA